MVLDASVCTWRVHSHRFTVLIFLNFSSLSGLSFARPGSSAECGKEKRSGAGHSLAHSAGFHIVVLGSLLCYRAMKLVCGYFLFFLFLSQLIHSKLGKSKVCIVRESLYGCTEDHVYRLYLHIMSQVAT